MRNLTVMLLLMIIWLSMACFPDREEVQKLAEISKTKIAMAKLSAALEVYNVEKGSYPENIKILQPDYIPSTDIKDAWGHKILYQLDRKQGYQLTSPGPDGIKDTDDDLICQNGEFIKPSSNKF